MSRFTGPQQRGAGRQARVEKRAAAEVRQRDARQRAQQQAPKPLTEAERAATMAVLTDMPTITAVALVIENERAQQAVGATVAKAWLDIAQQRALRRRA